LVSDYAGVVGGAVLVERTGLNEILPLPPVEKWMERRRFVSDRGLLLYPRSSPRLPVSERPPKNTQKKRREKGVLT
jgi:hypothetical protein